MAWFKVDDQLAFHPKAMAAGNDAMGLWIRAGSWASSHLTDGFIPNAMAIAMAGANGKKDLPSTLVEVGLWDEVEGGYQFHDWSDFQPDSEKERERRENLSKSRSEAGRKGAEARWSKENQGETLTEPYGKNGKPHGKRDGKQGGKTMAPSPSPSLSSNTGRRHRLPDTFEPADSHASKAKELNVDLHGEVEAFKDHHQAKGTTMLDWSKAFHGWLRNTEKFGPNAPRPSAATSTNYIWD